MAEKRIITDFQMDVMARFGESEYRETFYLTGGTALAEFYLRHRYSDDLDFFTPVETSFERPADFLENLARMVDAEVEFVRKFEQYLRAIFTRGHDIVITDWGYETPVRLDELREDPRSGIFYDSVLDIGANKISAVYGRTSIKDFIDLYFLEKAGYPFDMLYQRAPEKHIGIDDYWMAFALSQIEGITELPRMIKPVTIEELREHFIAIADRIFPGT